jgi:DNA adenine methylase
MNTKETPDSEIVLRPFLRWAGSKRLLLKHLVKRVPRKYGTYYEPFVGSGSLYLFLRPKKAVLNDKATEVIELFRALKSDVEGVITHANTFSNDRATFNRVRSSRSTDETKRAAEFLFLNKTCWNGLFRVNASGNFNVPYGDNKVAELFDAENLRACAELLQATNPRLTTLDFEDAVRNCSEGDLVYFDPPYVTGHNNNGFLEYNEKIFSWDDQIRLAKLASKLVTQGVSVIVSNAHHRDIVSLYPDFRKTIVHRSSTISGTVSTRRSITEVIFSAKNNGKKKIAKKASK